MNNLNQDIIEIRNKLQDLKIKKSGHNEFQMFEYFELRDFLPSLNKMMLEHGINDVFTFDPINDQVYATLILVKGDEQNTYRIPYTPSAIMSTNKDIQALGAANTYLKRYLYINAFGIVENDAIDGLPPEEKKVEQKTAREKMIDICHEYGLDIKAVADLYGLTPKSTDKDFRIAVKKILEDNSKGE